MSTQSFTLFGNNNGQNQFGNWGNTLGVGQTAPGIVPASNNTPSTGITPGSTTTGGIVKQGNLGATAAPMVPAFTDAFSNWLQTQVGQGATPFNLSSYLPSTGGTTAPGSLTAPMTPVLQQLEQFYTTGKGGPAGTDALAQMAATGNPTDVGPAWNAMVASQQQNTAQNLALMREQFASQGTLAGSPYSDATAQYLEQTNLDQNALLAQMHQQSSEAAAGRQLTAGGELTQGAGQLGQVLQGMDQASIQAMLQEFIRTRPEYSPLLNSMYGLATTFPPTNFSSGMSGIQSLLGSLGTVATGIGDAGAAAGVGGTAGTALDVIGAFCWVAAEVFDEDIITGPRVNLVRDWMLNKFEKTLVGKYVVAFYRKHGQSIAQCTKHSRLLKNALRMLFNIALAKAQE
jgi:hypothetical protein